MKKILTILLFLLIAGCGTSRKRDLLPETETQFSEKITCEAYLFDARITRDKKYNSFRLELYQTDSLIGLSGRGYLGKGALKGWISHDSLLVYFPTVQEYVKEANGDVWKSFKCVDEENQLNLFDLITSLPEDIIPRDKFELVILKNEDAEKEYRITKADCDWIITADYDLREKGWRLKEFHISEGEDFELRGKRREYRDEAKIKTGRYTPQISEEALRVIL